MACADRSAGDDSETDPHQESHTNATAPLVFAQRDGAVFSSVPLMVELGDLDGDGDLDAVVLTDRDGGVYDFGKRVESWNNDGSGTFERGSTVESGDPFDQVALGDVEADGDLDVFLGVQRPVVWTNDGMGSFQDIQLPGSLTWASSVRLGDLDSDGDIDFVQTPHASSGSSSEVGVWRNDGSGSFVEDRGQPSALQSDEFVVQGRLGDLDGDGDLDLLLLMQPGLGGDRVLWNQGDGSFEDSGQRLLPEGLEGTEGNHFRSSVALGDLDGDGDLDGVVSGYASAYALVNDGGGSLRAETLPLPGELDGRVVRLGDLDGDDDLDAVVFSWAHGLLFLRNDGAGAFEATEVDTGDSRSVAGALGDLDGDGDLDILSIHTGDARIFLNQTEHP